MASHIQSSSKTPRSIALNLGSREVIKIKGFDLKPIMKMKTRDEVIKNQSDPIKTLGRNDKFNFTLLLTVFISVIIYLLSLEKY